MSRIREVFRWTAKSPLRSILFVLALTLLVFGVYYISPFYTPNVISTASASIHYGIAFAAFGSSLYCLWAIFIKSSRRIHSAASLMFCTYTFFALLRLLATGLEPITWLFTLSLGLVAGICYLGVRNGD